MNKKGFAEDFAKVLEKYGIVDEGKYHIFFELERTDDEHVVFKDITLSGLFPEEEMAKEVYTKH